MFRKENGLSILSVELVVAVLSYLTYRDLLKCRQLCREVHDIIEHTSALRYKIELGLTGNQDGNSSKSVPDRLKELRRTQRDWQSPKPTLISSASVPSRDWSHAKWQKDVFFGRCPEDDRRLDVFNFSNAFAGDDSERLQQLQFDVPFDVYSVDFGQDLVAMARCSVANTETRNSPPPLVYLRSLKDQKHHPRAQVPSFNLASYGFPSVPFHILRARLQIAGEYLMLTLYKSLPVESIVVWHWPSGLVNALLQFTGEAICLNGMCTETGHLLLARRSNVIPGWFGIHVYALNKDEENPSLLASFELPRLKWDFRGWMTASFFPREHTSGILTGGVASGPIDFSPSSVLVQLQWDREYTLYTPLATFLSPEVLATRRILPLEYSWASWGPRLSRVFHEGTTVPVICGYRAIFPDYILDFSPATLRDSTSSSTSESSNAVALVQTEPTTEESTMFRNPVVTSLPYRRIPITLPSPPSTVNTRSLMHMAFVDVDGPKLLRVTCGDFILIPSSVEVYSISGPGAPLQDAPPENNHHAEIPK